MVDDLATIYSECLNTRSVRQLQCTRIWTTVISGQGVKVNVRTDLPLPSCTTSPTLTLPLVALIIILSGPTHCTSLLVRPGVFTIQSMVYRWPVTGVLGSPIG